MATTERNKVAKKAPTGTTADASDTNLPRGGKGKKWKDFQLVILRREFGIQKKPGKEGYRRIAGLVNDRYKAVKVESLHSSRGSTLK